MSSSSSSDKNKGKAATTAPSSEAPKQEEQSKRESDASDVDIALGQDDDNADEDEHDEDDHPLPDAPPPSTISGSSASKKGVAADKVPMCRRRRKREKQKSVRIQLGDEDEDEDEEDEYAELLSVEPSEELEFESTDSQAVPELIAASVHEALDNLSQSQYYNDEFCGEGDEQSCFQLQGRERDDEADADGDKGGADDDDWDYYYVPCDPDIDGMEEDEDESEEEDEEEEEEEEEYEESEPQSGAERPGESESMLDYGDEEDEAEDMFGPQSGEEEDEELKTLFMAKEEEEPEECNIYTIFIYENLKLVESLANIEGVVGLHLTAQTKQFFEIDDEEMLKSEHQVHKWLSWKKVKLHIFLNGELSEFYPYYDTIKYYPDVTMLLGSDPRKDTGEKYFFCLTVEARNNVLNPPKVKKVQLDLKKQQEQMWNELASKAPRKWRGYGSELEVDEEKMVDSRPLISVQVYRFRQHFGSDCKFEDAPKTNPENFSATFKSEPAETYPCIQAVEVDRAIQVMSQKQETATQTGFSFKRNKMVQYSTQSITEQNMENILNSKSMAKFFRKVTPRLDKVLQQNEMVDLLHDDYRNLKCKKGHEMEFSKDSLLLQEYQTYSDFKHSRGRTVTCMIFHPVLEDVVVMATVVDLTWEQRIDAHSKSLMEPNYVLFWDLRDSAHPQIMLDAPADVFSFQINPSEPHLVCGGCANGQIALWDLGRTYFELRAKIQDRQNLSTDTKAKRPSFLDKLKDSAETLSCPLIPVSGLSNLDLSHKRAVTSVAWVPPHIEVGKNGMVYDNRVGRSMQFMSVAGDGTLRLWDTRPQKKVAGQADDDDEDAAKDVIKVNKWAHLENNQWKYHFKFTLEDKQGGPMFATTVMICEKRHGAGKKEQDEVESVTTVAPSATSRSGEGSSSPEDPSPSSVPSTPGQPKKIPGVLTQNLNAQSTVLVGTETGDIGLVDWLRNKEGTVNPDFGNKTLTNVYLQTFHHGAITSIVRSPFYPELLLVVGGGTISIWKETCPYPIFLSGGFDVFPWCAIWSNSRPTVFYVGNRECSVSVWDLMDRSNGPVMTQAVTNVSITGIGLPKIAASASKNQYLAVTDSDGLLLVLLLPRFYARPLPNEDYVMTELMNREDNRMTSWMKEMEARTEKIQSVNYTWQQSRVTKTPEEANKQEIEQEGRLNEEYLQFIEFEQSMIGALKENEPVLPTMDTQISEEFDALISEAQRQEEDEEEEEEMDDEPLDEFDLDDFDDDDYDDT